MLHVWRGTEPENRFYYRPLDPPRTARGPPDAGEPRRPFVRLLDEADARYDFVDNAGSLFYFNTDLDAPRGRIIAIDVERPQREHWQEIVPQGDDPIDQVAMSTTSWSWSPCTTSTTASGATPAAARSLGEIPLPGLGTVAGLSGRREDTECFLGFTSFLYPLTSLRFDFATGELTTLRRPELDFDAAGYETRQVFYTSKDGTRVPMFLIHRKGLALDGDNPTLLYGYGGFNISLTPAFTVAPPGLARAGRRLRRGQPARRRRVRRGLAPGRDARAQAERLRRLHRRRRVADRRAATPAASAWPSRAAATAACSSPPAMTQRPDLFGAVVCQVPVADMLRYHRFTVGRYWTTDYGNAEADPEHFRFLYAYSPLHNVQPGTAYPPTLITTADTDDRVVPAHAKKFAAAAAARPPTGGDAPDPAAGGDQGRARRRQADDEADRRAGRPLRLPVPGARRPLPPGRAEPSPEAGARAVTRVPSRQEPPCPQARPGATPVAVRRACASPTRRRCSSRRTG